jgi:hypothetical protein
VEVRAVVAAEVGRACEAWSAEDWACVETATGTLSWVRAGSPADASRVDVGEGVAWMRRVDDAMMVVVTAGPAPRIMLVRRLIGEGGLEVIAGRSVRRVLAVEVGVRQDAWALVEGEDGVQVWWLALEGAWERPMRSWPVAWAPPGAVGLWADGTGVWVASLHARTAVRLEGGEAMRAEGLVAWESLESLGELTFTPASMVGMGDGFWLLSASQGRLAEVRVGVERPSPTVHEVPWRATQVWAGGGDRVWVWDASAGMLHGVTRGAPEVSEVRRAWVPPEPIPESWVGQGEVLWAWMGPGGGVEAWDAATLVRRGAWPGPVGRFWTSLGEVWAEGAAGVVRLSVGGEPAPP